MHIHFIMLHRFKFCCSIRHYSSSDTGAVWLFRCKTATEKPCPAFKYRGQMERSALAKFFRVLELPFAVSPNVSQDTFYSTFHVWHPLSGVRRLLDARGQRGSWMPSNFFQTSSLQNIFYSSPNISDDLLSNRSPTFLTIFFSLLGCPPSSAASCPDNNIFLFFSSHLHAFFNEN